MTTTADQPEEDLTPDQEYQRRYYRENVESRRKYAQDKWQNDREYREREIQRARDRRALERSQTASSRFKKMVEDRRAERAPTKPPQLVPVGDGLTHVYTSGSLSREVGRSTRAVRMWMNDGTLPGATVFLDGRAYFSKPFCEAVYRACKRLFHLNGRGEKRVLKRLILEELHEADIKYVPYGEDNSVRVKANIEG